MPTMALWTDVVVRLSGSRKRTAASDQYPAQTASGVMERPMPWAAADEATPTGRSLQSTQRRGGRGQAMRPSSPYMSTDPGAPVSALAVPVRSMPMPSPMTQTPSTQTNDTASAGRTVRRKSRPTPMKSWISAKKVFHTATSGATKFPMWVMRSPRTKGCPWRWAGCTSLDEAPAEHEGLELQGGVEDPEQAEDDLEHPLGADGEWEAAVRRLVLSCPGTFVHALTYATGGPPDGLVRATGSRTARSRQPGHDHAGVVGIGRKP